MRSVGSASGQRELVGVSRDRRSGRHNTLRGVSDLASTAGPVGAGTGDEVQVKRPELLPT